MEGLLLLCIIILVLVFVIGYCAAKEFYLAAVEKGYDDKKYLWWTFWLFPVGAAMVIALPDKRNNDRLFNVVRDLAESAATNKDVKSANNRVKRVVVDELPEL